MRPENREKSAELEPADIEFPICRVLPGLRILSAPIPRLTTFYKESADVHAPVGKSGQREALYLQNLRPKRFPARAGISGPENAAIPLLSDRRASCQDDRPSLAALFPALLAPFEMFINPERMKKGISICQFLRHIGACDHQELLHHLPGFRFDAMSPLRRHALAGIHPEGVKAAPVKLPPGLFPIEFSGSSVEGIVQMACRKEAALLSHFLIIRAAFIHVRPDGNHTVYVLQMQCMIHHGSIRKTLRIKCLLSPLPILPAAPVQNDSIKTDVLLPVCLRHREQLLLRAVALFGLQIAEAPSGEQRRLPREFPVRRYDALHPEAAVFSGQEIKIQFLRCVPIEA